MLYKFIAFVIFGQLMIISQSLTGFLGLLVSSIGALGGACLLAQIIKTHIQATKESYNPPAEAGLITKILAWLKAFTYSAWFIAFANSQMVISDTAPDQMTFLEHFKHLTTSGSIEAENWSSPVFWGIFSLGLASLIGSSLLGMAISAEIITLVFFGTLILPKISIQNHPLLDDFFASFSSFIKARTAPTTAMTRKMLSQNSLTLASEQMNKSLQGTVTADGPLQSRLYVHIVDRAVSYPAINKNLLDIFTAQAHYKNS
jgi:hypothetical protein